jgi:hypothetical protein
VVEVAGAGMVNWYLIWTLFFFVEVNLKSEPQKADDLGTG